jgi:uncharacterized low-complexity protein
MNIKMKLAGLFLGALLATTSAFAAESTTGTPKCGAEMKKEMKGSCGAGKCGAEMKKEMKDEMKDAKEAVKGSCGAGKCGSK